MPDIRVSHEQRRGCGYRKKGGLYLVSGKLNAPCGKLPMPLHVCPTCSGGIKPSRSWTWIRPRALFAEATCNLSTEATQLALLNDDPNSRRIMRAIDHCSLCPAGGMMPERAGLLWVGGSFYETADDFVKEAARLGISRRIPAVPKGCEPGKTVVYLAHREVITSDLCAECEHECHSADGCSAACPCKSVLVKRTPGVFTAFVPSAVEYVVKGDEAEEELDRIEKRGIQLVDVKPVDEKGQMVFDLTPAEKANVPGASDDLDEDLEESA